MGTEEGTDRVTPKAVRSVHRCYGLTIESDILLPDLGSTVDAPEGGSDVTVRLGDLGPRPAEAVALTLGLWRLGDRIGFAVPGTGAFLVEAGRRIVADPEPDADPAAVRLYVLGTALGALMSQRNHLVLHGNAFRVGDAAAVVVGPSGAGKSTLAAELHRRGIEVLSDDVVPVDPHGRALLGFPRIKLCEDAADRLGLDTTQLDRVARSVPKFQLPVRRTTTDPLPVRWVYVLERHTGPELEIEPASGMEAFSLLHENTYRNELLHGREVLDQHLVQCAELAARARISRVTRPVHTMTAEATADAILSDIAAREDPTQESA